MDRVLTKPISASGYSAHRLVAGLLEGEPALYVDRGDHLLIRTDRDLPGTATAPLRSYSVGSILGFTLRASTGRKVKGRHRYWHTSDWRSRHAWLDRQASRHGFQVISVHCTATMAKVEKTGRTFTLDQTDFTGVLKVLDADLFTAALRSGIGSTGKAFGMGMLCL